MCVHRLGLDKPFATQYKIFLLHALHGDLGVSIRSHKPVTQEIAERFPYTLALTTVSYAFAVWWGLRQAFWLLFIAAGGWITWS